MVGLSLGLAGCFDGNPASSDAPPDSGVVSADAFDCDDVERPDPSTPDRDGALEPATYPDPPAPSAETVDEFVREFEAAYRRNAFIETYAEEAVGFDFEFDSQRTNEVESESGRDAVLVSIVYHLTTETRPSNSSSEQYTRVTYYIDENIVLRAAYEGVADSPSFDPDPRTEGEPVACPK